MKVYEILGTYKDEDAKESFGLWPTRERAEQRLQNEEAAYTYKGVLDWTFEIVEHEVRA